MCRAEGMSSSGFLLCLVNINPLVFVPKMLARTKRFMSNESWDGPAILFLPHMVARAMQGDSPPGQTQILQERSLLNLTHLCYATASLTHAVFWDKPVNPDSDENRAFRKYAALMSFGLSQIVTRHTEITELARCRSFRHACCVPSIG